MLLLLLGDSSFRLYLFRIRGGVVVLSSDYGISVTGWRLNITLRHLDELPTCNFGSQGLLVGDIRGLGRLINLINQCGVRFLPRIFEEPLFGWIRSQEGLYCARGTFVNCGALCKLIAVSVI